MKRVLITGGAGYLGSILTVELLTNGWEVRIFDACYFGKKHLQVHQKKINIVHGDIRKIQEKSFEDIDVIIHLAALSNDPMANFAPNLNYEINTHATIRLAHMAKKVGVKQFIFASSCSIYHRDGNTTHIYNEDDLVEPKEFYSRSKYLAEQELLALNDKRFTVTVVRMGTIGGYSPRMRFDLVVNTMFKTAVTEGKIYVHSGNHHRPLIDIGDVAKAYMRILRTPSHKISGEIFNICENNYQINNLAQLVAKSLRRHNKTVHVQEIPAPIKVRSYKVSSTKIKRLLGYEASVTPFYTVEHMLSYFQQYPIKNYNHPIYYNIEWTKLGLKKMEAST